jgi:hypothetical protein
MSSTVETLRALVAGEPIDRGRLLHGCIGEAFGTEVFGEHAIRELFARNLSPLSSTPHWIVGERHVAVFDADAKGHQQALFVDVYGERIARLWRLGEGSADAMAEPRLRVAIDPFLNQRRESVDFAAGDFPTLDPDAAQPMATALAQIVEGPLGPHASADRRVIALRAFSAGSLAASLGCVLSPRTAPMLAAVAVRLAAGRAVRSWCVLDAPRAVPVLDDLTMGRSDHAQLAGRA